MHTQTFTFGTDKRVNPSGLHEALSAAYPAIFDSLDTVRDGDALRVTLRLQREPTRSEEDGIAALLDSHDPDVLTADQQAQAQREALLAETLDPANYAEDVRPLVEMLEALKAGLRMRG